MLKKIIVLFTIIITEAVFSQKTSILVFTKTAGYRHKSIIVGKNSLKKIAERKNWKITFSEDATIFNDNDLSNFNALLFLNTTGDILNDEQQKAMKGFLTKGKGFIGVHAALDTEKNWPWYSEMLGAVFKSHPKTQKATLHIDSSYEHPAVAHLNSKEEFVDEWYNFTSQVGKHINVLAILDESTYTGKQMGMEHPITWYHHYDGARVFYTGLGHTNESFLDSRFIKQLEGAIS